MAKQRYVRRGQTERKAAGRKPPKGSNISRVALASLTFLNLLLTLMLHVLRRVEIIHAVQNGDGTKVLLEVEKKTVIPSEKP